MEAGKALLLSRTALASAATSAFSVIQPIYLASLGMPTWAVGAYIGAAAAVGAASGFLLSAVADAYGRRRVALASAVLPIVGLAILYLGAPAGILLLYVGPGGAYAALYMEYVRDPDRDWSHMAATSVAASSLGALLPAALSPRETVAAVAAMSAAGAAAVAIVRERYRGSGRVDLRLASIGTLARLSSASVIGMGAGILLPMLPLWFKLRYGVPAGPIGELFSVQNALMILAFWAAPAISRGMGRLRAIVASQAAGVALLSLVPLSPSFDAAAALWIARSASMNMANPLISAMLNDLVPEAERARANSVYQLLDSAPRSLGPYLTGYLMGSGQLDAPFYITASLYAAATAMLYALMRGRAR